MTMVPVGTCWYLFEKVLPKNRMVKRFHATRYLFAVPVPGAESGLGTYRYLSPLGEVPQVPAKRGPNWYEKTWLPLLADNLTNHPKAVNLWALLSRRN